ncbi:NifB/NifX family molybdenum-iron cluster-binding protein [Oscillibacter sp.]|uniref:NifB/NifX family molybdenum-iron cluster-binding protein n=1 Tax=Oscillibacter sp. TaxID=1945593 RepID=UPI0028B09D87|nr:NifB/NifX family molybdenum-iron cluster-binding protein [Oscillibacter sp.]
MIIVIPVDEGKEKVCVSFGRTPYFLIHNTETQETQTVENPATEAQGGAGIQAAQFVVDTGANTLITVRCGQNAADVFKAAKIKICKSMGGSADDQLKAFAEGKLDELTSFHAGFHGKV